MSGVVNLVSRRPGTKPEHQLLLNRSSRGATDAGLWYSTPLSDRWGFTLLGSANGQERTDVDDDGWADLPKYARAVVRPRLFWDDHAGRTFFATAGGTWEDRTGGSMPGEALARAGGAYVEALETRRSDAGAAFQMLAANGVMWSLRGSWTSQRQNHQYGDVVERDDHDTGFAELTVRRAIRRHTLVGGLAIERDRFQPIDLPRFGYTYTVPGVFVQDDLDVVALARGIGERPAGPAQRVRHLRQPAYLRAPAARAMVEPRVLWHRVLRADGCHRGDRGHRVVTAHRPQSVEGRTRKERVFRCHAHARSAVGHL